MVWFRLEDVCPDDAEGTNQLMVQLPEDMEGDYDCEELFNVSSYQIVKNDYKEFYRQMVTEELNIGIGGFENLNAVLEDINFRNGNYYKDLVRNWEEFYDENFKPFKNEPKKINGAIDIWAVIKPGAPANRTKGKTEISTFDVEGGN